MRKKAAGKATVLVVDDNEGVRQAFAETLTEAGYKVIAAADGEEAHNVVLEQTIQLALVDIRMEPGIDGISLIKRWSEQGLLKFPAAIVSGHATIELGVQAMKYGAIDVLNKPVGGKDLLAFVNKSLKSGSADIYDAVLRGTDFGQDPVLLDLKGDLLRNTASIKPVLLVGPPAAGCEFYARLLHNVGKPWMELQDLRFLATNPTGRLGEVANGTIYLRGLSQLNRVQQRGLYLLIRNAPAQNVRLVVESVLTLDGLQAGGHMDLDLAKAFEGREVAIPAIEECRGSLLPLMKLAARTLALGSSGREPIAAFDDAALQLLADDSERWLIGGFESVLNLIRMLLHAARGGQVTAALVQNMLYGAAPAQTAAGEVDDRVLELPLRAAREHFERRYFRKLMSRAENNYKLAAELSGLDRAYIYRKVQNLLGQGFQADS